MDFQAKFFSISNGENKPGAGIFSTFISQILYYAYIEELWFRDVSIGQTPR